MTDAFSIFIFTQCIIPAINRYPGLCISHRKGLFQVLMHVNLGLTGIDSTLRRIN